jgi:hypothetical protein
MWVGATLLLACLLSVDLAWRVVTGATHGVVANLIPVAYLAGGWLLFLLGLVKLSGERRRRSEARGPWLVVGLLFFVLCAPLAGSFAASVDAPVVHYTCDCGARVQARGERNCWGQWLRREVKVMRAPLGATAQGCGHLQVAPW